MADIIQIRGGTAAAATSTNPILAERELGIETDTLKMKLGDGVTAWTGLSYLPTGGGSSLTQVVVAADANITAAANTILVIPHGIMTANRTINIDALASDTDELHIFNHERTYSITFAGSHTIYTYGNEVYDNTEALRVAPFKLIRLNSELRQNT